MTRVAREFENLLLAVRSSVATQRPATCELLDNLIEKTKACYKSQSWNQYFGIAAQVLTPAIALVAGSGYFKAKYDVSLQWGSKLGDIFKTGLDAYGLDYQAQQKQIDTTSAELAAVNQGHATFLQSLETAMQRHQQIQDNAKR